MSSENELKICRAICRCWETVYADEHVSIDMYTGTGMGFHVHELGNNTFQINFENRRCWWIAGDHVADVKDIVKQKLQEAGLHPTKLKIHGKTFIINWKDNRKYVKIHRIIFVDNTLN